MADVSERLRQKAFKDYSKFRKDFPKTDATFLDATSRRQRVADTEAKLNHFLEGLLLIADDAKFNNRDCYMILDVETDYVISTETSRRPEPFFWHKRQLKQKGYTDEQITKRSLVQNDLALEFSAIKNAKTRQNQRPQFDADSRSRGLVKSDVFSFQIAAIQDENDDFTFAAHTVKLEDVFGGRDGSSLLHRLFSHKSIVWLNVSIEEDLKAMNRAFFDDKLSGLRFLDMKTVAEHIYGSPLPRRQGVDGQGALGLFQLAFLEDNLTWKKSPLLTRNHWWSMEPWPDNLVEYALMDVHSMVLVLRKWLPKLRDSPGSLASPFPLIRRKSGVDGGGFRGRRGDGLLPTANSVTASFAFKSSSDDSENDIFMSDPIRPRPTMQSSPPDAPTPSSSTADSRTVISNDDPLDAPEEVVEDLRDVLFEDYASDIDGERSFPSGPSASSQNRRDAFPHADVEAIQEFCESDDDATNDQYDEPLGERICSKLATMLRKGKKVDLKRLEKIAQLPFLLARSISRVKGPKAIFRRSLKDILIHFSTRWNEAEKRIFFDNTTDATFYCGPIQIAKLLKLENFEITTLISLNHKTVIDFISERRNLAEPLLSLLASLYGKPTAEKLKIFKSMVNPTKESARYFLLSAVDGNLASLASAVSGLGFERPLPFRKADFVKCFSEAESGIVNGVLEFEQAVKKITRCVAGERAAALDVMSPFTSFYAHFVNEWTDNVLDFDPPSSLICEVDDFHEAPIRVIKVLTDVVAKQVADRIRAVDRLTIVYRRTNDYAFNPEATGVVGFTAAHWDEAFFIFPFSLPSISATVASAAKSKTIACNGVNVHKSLFGNEWKFVELGNPPNRKVRRSPLVNNLGLLLKSKGVAHCRNHMYSLFVRPEEVSDVALRHAAAELFFFYRLCFSPPSPPRLKSGFLLFDEICTDCDFG